LDSTNGSSLLKEIENEICLREVLFKRFVLEIEFYPNKKINLGKFMRIRITVSEIDFYEFKEALKNRNLNSILNLKKRNNKSNRSLGFGKKG